MNNDIRNDKKFVKRYGHNVGLCAYFFFVLLVSIYYFTMLDTLEVLKVISIIIMILSAIIVITEFLTISVKMYKDIIHQKND